VTYFDSSNIGLGVMVMSCTDAGRPWLRQPCTWRLSCHVHCAYHMLHVLALPDPLHLTAYERLQRATRSARAVSTDMCFTVLCMRIASCVANSTVHAFLKGHCAWCQRSLVCFTMTAVSVLRRCALQHVLPWLRLCSLQAAATAPQTAATWRLVLCCTWMTATRKWQKQRARCVRIEVKWSKDAYNGGIPTAA
jgi:hypothetical protein